MAAASDRSVAEPLLGEVALSMESCAPLGGLDGGACGYNVQSACGCNIGESPSNREVALSMGSCAPPAWTRRRAMWLRRWPCHGLNVLGGEEGTPKRRPWGRRQPWPRESNERPRVGHGSYLVEVIVIRTRHGDTNGGGGLVAYARAWEGGRCGGMAGVSSTGHLNTGKAAVMEEADAKVQEAKRSTRAKRLIPKYIGNVWMN
jgi:hypothetical protein